MKTEDIEIRSEEVRDILGAMPSWIIRWGISVIFIVIAIFILVSILVEYPEVLRTRVKLTTQTLPANMKARFSGRISQIFVQENQQVAPDEVLVLLSNSANYQDILKVKEAFNAFYQVLLIRDSIPQALLPRQVNLGEIQPEYTELLKEIQYYELFTNSNLYADKLLQLDQQIQTHQAVLPKLQKQKEILNEQFSLTEEKHRVYRSFLSDSVIAPLDYNDRKKNYLEDQYKLEDVEIAESREQLQIQSYQKEKLALKDDFMEQSIRLATRIRQAALNFEAKLKNWEDIYLLKSPIAGTITFFKPLAQEQFINTGEEIITIIPQESPILGYAYVSSAGFGKVEAEQKVKIRLDAFPYREFGIVNGEVASIAEMAKDGQYLVKIKVDQNLETSYQKRLNFTQEMQGDAFIITQELRLIQRVFYQFKYLFTESF